MKEDATGCLKRDFDGLGCDGLMFGASAMWLDSGVFDHSFVFADVINMLGMPACCLVGCPWKCGRQAFVSTHVCRSSTPEVPCLCDDMWSGRV